MITLGLVDSVDTNGVYVTMPGSRGVLRGPYATLQNVAAGDKVLVVTTDDGINVIVGLAGASIEFVDTSADAGSYAGHHLRTGTERRWFIGKNNTAESGSDAGSNFIIWAYDDTGAQTHKPFAIYRNTGRIIAGLSGASAGIDLSLNGPRVLHGTGDPNGTYAAPVGSTFHRTDGGAGTSFYVKESGTGNTGWVAK